MRLTGVSGAKLVCQRHNHKVFRTCGESELPCTPRNKFKSVICKSQKPVILLLQDSNLDSLFTKYMPKLHGRPQCSCRTLSVRLIGIVIGSSGMAYTRLSCPGMLDDLEDPLLYRPEYRQLDIVLECPSFVRLNWMSDPGTSSSAWLFDIQLSPFSGRFPVNGGAYGHPCAHSDRKSYTDKSVIACEHGEHNSDR